MPLAGARSSPPSPITVRLPAREGRVRDRLIGGSSLVELLIGLAAVSIVSSLAVMGGSRYLAASRSADAKQAVTAIAQAAAAAYERSEAPRAPCSGSTSVPADFSLVQNRAHVPSTQSGADFNTGSETVGWRCLAFSMTKPLYYQYSYAVGNGSDWSGQLSEPYFVARAQGDLDGDGFYARFTRGGQMSGGSAVLQTEVWASQETE